MRKYNSKEISKLTNPYKQYEKQLVGKTLNYKNEFCPTIKEDYKTAKARELHFGRLSKFMEIKSLGRNVYVSRIFDEDEIKVAEIKGRFLTHFENFIILSLCECAKQDVNSLTLTVGEIMEKSAMINENYFKGYNSFEKNYLDVFKKQITINKLDVDNLEKYSKKLAKTEGRILFGTSYRLIRRVVQDCIKSMEKSQSVFFSQGYVLYKNVSNKNFANINWTTNRVVANEEQTQRIIKVQNEAVLKINEYLKEKCPPKDNLPQFQISGFDKIYKLVGYQKRVFRKIQHDLIKAEFKNEFTNYSKAYKLTLADEIDYEQEIKSRKFDPNILNQNIISKISDTKYLTDISPNLKRMFIDTFLKIGQTNL